MSDTTIPTVLNMCMLNYTNQKMGVTTVRIPEYIHNEAKNKRINISLACVHGIRIHLGYYCPLKEKCKCFKKAEMLQDLLLKMEQKFLEMDDKFRRQKDHAWTMEEKRKL